MNRILIATLAAVLTLALPTQDAEAKRLSGGGMKRSVPTQPAPKPPAPQPASPQQAAPATPAAPAPAAAPKRSWLGPIAGLAAGLGLAALASHFGFGEGLANVMMIALLAMVAFAAIRFLMRRFNPAPRPQLAAAGGASLDAPQQPQQAQAYASGAPVTGGSVPADFDAAGFEKIAKQVFIRMQAANDAGDQADLRRFTTPQMYASIQQELLERGTSPQTTEVLRLDAHVVDVAHENGQQVVSVRFSGLVREQHGQGAEDFDEIWHLVRAPGSEAWQIAGIQQTA